MAKQKKKIEKQQPAAATRTVNSTSSSPAYQKYLPYVVTGLFFLLSLIGILNHEMWRDEFQAWMVARDAHSIPGLFQNVKYEGNPALWHLFLYIITSFTHNAFWMQVFHILLSTATVFLVCRYAPFSVWEKLLFSFGYFAFYEYNIIARSYGLGLLLVVIFCILYKNRQRYYVPIAVVLFLLANVHVFGLLFSLSFSGIMLLDYIIETQADRMKKVPVPLLLVSALIILVGCAASVWQIQPEPDNTFPVSYPASAFDPMHIKNAFARIMDAYFAVPDLSSFHFWNTNQFETTTLSPALDNPTVTITTTNVKLFFPLLAFIVFALHFLRKPLIMLLYVLATAGMFIFFYYTNMSYMRYSGHFFVLLIATMWLSYYYKEQKFNNQFVHRLSGIANTAGKYLFLLLLVIGFCGGVFAYQRDLQDPFSASKEAAEFIRQNKLEKLDMFGETDVIVSTLSGWLDRQIYYPNSSSLGSFIIWDKKHKVNSSQKDMFNWVLEKDKQGVHTMLVVLHYQPSIVMPGDTKDSPLVEGMLTDKLRIHLLKAIPAGIVEEEKFFIYLVDEIKQ